MTTAADTSRRLPDLDELEARFDEVDSKIHAFLPEEARFDRLRVQLEEAADPWLMLGVKDIFHVDGLPTRAGSRLPAEALAGAEATSVTRLRAAGALVLGKTVSTEFAYFAPGPTRNPRSLEHTPGGSSSGSAAAVAAGLCPLALGTQTIGSICRPASYCGVVGFKPSYGRIPTDGVIPLAPSLDHIGIIATDVALAAQVAAVLCDGWSNTGASSRPRIGIPEGPLLERPTLETQKHFRNALQRLHDGGYPVTPVDTFAALDKIEARHRLILEAEAAAVHLDWFDRHAGLYHPTTVELIEAGQAVDPTELDLALHDAAMLLVELERTMENNHVELWLTPSTTGPAPRGLESTGDPTMNLPWTQVGMPAISLPSGTDAEGLPLGLQLVARLGRDEQLLAWAVGIEEILEQ